MLSNRAGKEVSILCISIILSTKGCAQTQFLVTTGNSHEPWTGPVRILREAPNDIEYEEIGWVSGRMGYDSDWGNILKEMQKESAERGANAIILVDKEASTQIIGLQWPFYGSSYEEKKLMAIAVRILQNSEDAEGIEKARVNARPYSPNPYMVHRKIAGWGLASTWGATVVGSLAMNDASFGTTAIPVIGPFVTMTRIESDPSLYYLPGGKPLLIASGVAQTGFLVYFIASWAGEQSHNYNPRFSIFPSSHLVGATMRYRF